jgi:hypothetical protein
VPAAIDERQIGTGLVAGDAASIDALLLDKGFTGRRFAGEMAGAGIEVIIPPARAQRQTMPKTLQRQLGWVPGGSGMRSASSDSCSAIGNVGRGARRPIGMAMRPGRRQRRVVFDDI